MLEQEQCSAHGRTVNKQRAEQEPRSAHGRAVNKLHSIFFVNGTRSLFSETS